jgi:hypothetical protein
LLGTVAIMFLDVSLHCVFGVASGVNYMAHRDMSVVCRCFVTSSLVVLGSFFMMTRRMRKML